MSIIGTRVVRKEDPALLTVGGRYVADEAPEDALHATFVRSDMAHALIKGIDRDDALAMPGVVAVYTAADLGLQPVPPIFSILNQAMVRHHLAADRVRYVGDPFAVVISETRPQGADAAGTVFAHYEPLEAVLSPSQALEDAVLLFPAAGTNTVFKIDAAGADDLFDGCDTVVSLTFTNPRMNPSPIEPRSVASQWSTGDDGRPRLTQWSCTQRPHAVRDSLAARHGLEPDQVRVITPDVGGAFGGKSGEYPEDFVVAACARRLRRAVRWTETRSESMLNLAHGRAAEFEATIGGTRDGRITAYKVHVTQDSGGYVETGAVLPFITCIMASGPYDIARVEFSSVSVVTNTAPVGSFRGAGRPEATHALERMVDRFAAELGIDPVEVRKQNFIAPEAFPFTTPTGADMDLGEYAEAADAVAEAAGYSELRAEQERRRHHPTEPLLGLGWCTYTEIANPVGEGEFGSIEVRPDGSAVVLTGSSSHGQGHHTTFAQLASEVTGIDLDRIEVRHGDTAEVKRGGGTGGSRSLQAGGCAVFEASRRAVEQARQIAAAMLEADPDDVVLDPARGSFSVAGTPAVSRTWADVAAHQLAHHETPLLGEADIESAATYPFGAHLSVVEVDRHTGEVRVRRHVCCDDAGVIINPMIVDGQIHGGAGAGVGLALMEAFVYDDAGNPLTGNFMDYGIPSAAELPRFERIANQTPTDRNPLGAKGIGEAGTIGATPAVQNAVVDALAHLGVTHIEMPATPQRVWRTIQSSRPA